MNNLIPEHNTLKLEPPKDPKVFEELCRDVLSLTKAYRKKKYVIYGRNGEPQHGIDLHVDNNFILSDNFSVLVQCKKYSDTNDFVNKIEKDYKNAVEYFAEFNPNIFVVMTALRCDTKIDEKIAKIKIKRKVAFHIWYWDKIEEIISNNVVLLFRYYQEHYCSHFLFVKHKTIDKIISSLVELQKNSEFFHDYPETNYNSSELSELRRCCYKMARDAENIIVALKRNNNKCYLQLNKGLNLGDNIENLASSVPLSLDQLNGDVSGEDLCNSIETFIKYYKDDNNYEQFSMNCQAIISILNDGRR